MDGLRSLNAFWAEICLGQQQNFVGNFFGSTKFWSEIFLGQQNFGQKFFGVKKCWVTKNCGSKKFGVNKNSGRKFVWVNKKNWVKKIVGQQKFGRKFFWVNFFFVGFFCVRHPWWRTKRSWPLFSPTFSFFLFLRLLLFTHFGETPMAEINFPPIIWHN